MPSIGQTWVLASIGAVVEMGVLSTLKRLLMESNLMYRLNTYRRQNDREGLLARLNRFCKLPKAMLTLRQFILL
jgi:hypothetical protein